MVPFERVGETIARLTVSAIRRVSMAPVFGGIFLSSPLRPFLENDVFHEPFGQGVPGRRLRSIAGEC